MVPQKHQQHTPSTATGIASNHENVSTGRPTSKHECLLSHPAAPPCSPPPVAGSNVQKPTTTCPAYLFLGLHQHSSLILQLLLQLCHLLLQLCVTLLSISFCLPCYPEPVRTTPLVYQYIYFSHTAFTMLCKNCIEESAAAGDLCCVESVV